MENGDFTDSHDVTITDRDKLTVPMTQYSIMMNISLSGIYLSASPVHRYTATHAGLTQCLCMSTRLSWLFNASSALFPSIYLDKDLFPSVEDRALRVQGILRESLRVRDNLRELQQCEDCQQDKTKPIYAYTMYRYRQEQFYITPDLENTIGQSFDAGLDGVVVWDSSANFRNMTDCLSMRDYLDHTLGPYINSVNSFADQCYIQWCSGHGRCLRIAWPPTKSEEATDNQKHTDQPNRREFSMYRCDCSLPWTGEHCEDQL